MAQEDGVWVALEWDRSSVIPFLCEIDALRYVNSNGGGHVKFVKFGKDVLEE